MNHSSQNNNHLLNGIWEEVILDMLREQKGGELNSDELDLIYQIVEEIESATYLQD